MAEQIFNEIIVDVSKAVNPLKQLDAQFDTHTATLKRAAAGESQFNVSTQGVIATQKRQAEAVRKSASEVRKSAAASKAATAAAKQHTQELKKQIAAAKDLGLSWKSVRRIFVGQVIFRALSAITNQLRDSVGEARELGIKLAEAVTIAPGVIANTTEGVERLGQEVRVLSESFGVDQVELATAAYQVYSNQIGDANESTKFLADSVLFAKATVTNTANAVDLLSGVINSYGLEAKEAARVSDIFTKAVELGRFRIDDIANSMGRVNPIASQLGIQIEEVAAALATLTIKGVSPDKALTQLLAVMLKMVKPSGALTKALNEIGFTNIKAATSTLGLVGTLKALTATTDGSVEALGRLFPRVRGIQGVLGLLNDEGTRFAGIFEEIQNESDGATKKFAEFILATESEELNRNIQAIKNLFIEDFGKVVIKTVNDVLEAMGGVPGAAKNIEQAMKTVGIALAGVAIQRAIFGYIALETAMIGGATAAGILSAALTRIPFVLLAIGAAALGQEIAVLIDRYALGGLEADKFAESQANIEQRTKELADTFAKSSFDQINAIKRQADARIDAVQNSLRIQIQLEQEVADRTKFLGTEVTASLISELARRSKAFQDFAKDSANAIELAEKDIAKIDDSISKIKSRSEQELFDLRIRNLSKWDQRVARARRAQSLLQRAAITTDKEERAELLRTASAEASRAKSANLVKRVSEARVKILEAEKVQLRKNATILSQLSPTINKATGEMKKLRIEAQGFEEQLALAISQLDKVGAARAAENLRNVVKEFEDTQKAIEKLLGRAFSIKITPLREGIKNVFSDPTLISFKIDNALNEMEAILKDRKITKEIFFKLAPFGATPDTTPEEAGGILNNLKEQVSKDAEELELRLVKDISKAIASAEETLKNSELITGLDVFPTDFIGEFVPGFKEARAQFEAEAQGIEDAFNKLVTAAEESDFDKTKKAITGIVEALEGAKNIDTEKAKIAIEQLRNAFQPLLNIKSTIENTLKTISEESVTSAGSVGAIGTQATIMADKAITASSRTVSALQTIGSAATNQIAGVNALAFALANLASQRAAAATVATGGQIPAFLAGGGPTQSRGTDTVSVQAAPGEMFVNAASSRRFVPELTAINQGRAPEPRNNAQTTNNSFSGDININVPSGAKIDGRQITQDIRRELRRKTSSLS